MILKCSVKWYKVQNPVYRYQHAGASCLKILQSPKQVSEWTCRTLTKLCGVISPKGTLQYLSGVSSSSHRLVSLDKTELELLSKASINHAYNIISTMHTAENQLNYRHVYNIKSTMQTAENQLSNRHVYNIISAQLWACYTETKYQGCIASCLWQNDFMIEIKKTLTNFCYLSSSSCGILKTSGSCWLISYNFCK